MKLNLYHLIQEQIKKEIAKHLKSISSTPFTAFTPPSEDTTLVYNKFEQFSLGSFFNMFNKRLAYGCEPVKNSKNTVYMDYGLAIFSENKILEIDATTIEIPQYSESRWVWVYLKPDGTFTANKYAPIVGDNKDYIPICKVWKEHDSDDFDAKTLRDLRPVGFASNSIFHLLRQQFLNLFLGLPKVFLDTISIEPTDPPSLSIKINSSGDGILYASFNPVPDTTMTLSTENIESGEIIDFLIIASAKVDDYDPNDFKWNFKFKKTSENLEEYEIPLGIIKGVTQDTTEITSDMIEILGYQKTRKDFYSYDLNFFYYKKDRDWLVKRKETSTNTTTGKEIILAITDTSSPRTIYLSHEDLTEGRIIIIKDESGNAGNNNISVYPEVSGILIDGEDHKVINSNYGVLRLYSNGNNWFTF